jgi:hypothetical protein
MFPIEKNAVNSGILHACRDGEYACTCTVPSEMTPKYIIIH